VSRRHGAGGDPGAEVLLHGATLLDAPRASGARPRRPSRPREAVLIRGDRIAAVGRLDAVRRAASRGATRVDLGGGTLMPGFTDAHIHLITWIRALREPWLSAQDVTAIERAVRDRIASAPEEEWLVVRGWVPREWTADVRVLSTLDRIAPDRPLVLHAADGHSVWANGVALARVGIGEGTQDPAGGVVERDRRGALTGALVEEAAKLLRPRVPQASTPREDLARAIAEAHSLGITGAHDFDRTLTWRPAQDLERDGKLRFRLLLSIPVASLDAAAALGLGSGLGSDRLQVGPVKMFADGTLGSATALLEDPYEGRADRGIEVLGPAELTDGCCRAMDSGLTVAIHAIGDRAVRNALDAIAEATHADATFPRPPRIEHVQLARTEDLSRFRTLGVLASVQPIHLLTDRAVASRFWGPRTSRSYAYRGLLGAGARVLFGSDAPFDRAGPLLGVQAAVLRRAADEAPTRVFHAEQRLTLAQALRAHLEEPHRAAGWSIPMGRLAPGYAADVVHFDHDLAGMPVERWHEARVTRVWVGGERVYGPRRG
jgi:predicted amidohydrolase YtcJ